MRGKEPRVATSIDPGRRPRDLVAVHLGNLLLVVFLIIRLDRTGQQTTISERLATLGTCIVASFLALIPLLVGFGLGLIWLTLLIGERFPLLAEDLADLT